MIRTWAMLLVLLCCSKVFAAQSREVVVGVYPNAPKIFAAEDGLPSGILGELLLNIAQQEQWQLKTVQCDWAYCLQLLQSGEIDLLPDVAFTTQRALQLDFHHTPALISWSQLYTAAGVTIDELDDLNNKRIAAVQDSVQLQFLQKTLRDAGYHAELLTTRSLAEAFRMVSSGKADAVVANHYYGEAHLQQYNLSASPALFEPVSLFYATQTGRNRELLDAIEQYLLAWQNNIDSPYYQILQRWGSGQPLSKSHDELRWLLSMLVALLLLALGGTWLLRRQVADKTRHLKASEDRLNTIMNSVDVHIYIKDSRLRYEYINRKVAELFGCEPEQAVGRRDDAFFDAQTCAMLQQNDLKVLQQGVRLVEEETKCSLDGSQCHTYLSVKLPLRNEQGDIYALCGISTDITDHKEQQQEIHQLAFYDALTGLANRRMLLDRLQQAVARHERRGDDARGALLFIDLDHFKDLNDTLGHAVGDQLLQQVAQRLQHNLRKVDTLARLGGDEFVVLLTDLHPDATLASQKAGLIADKVVQLLAEPFVLQERACSLSASVGVVMFSDGCNGYELLQRADLAMYDAKGKGRNGMRFYDPQMQQAISERAEIAAGLRHAVLNNEFVLQFQPQLEWEQGIVGAEVLLRWQHPQQGMMAPAQFIPIAESTGQILQIGRWVLEQSCQQLAEWARYPHSANWYLAVNISARQLHAANFVDEVSRALEHSGAAPEKLVLELTESQLLQDVETVIEKMHQLTALGVRFSLDDFGTGYSSLSYLKLLPLQQLKIDRSFVRDILTDPNDKVIIKTILALGKSLELAVIAEGVETEAQYQQLLQLGCQQFQGYYFGMPLSLHDFTQLAQHSQPQQ